MSRQATDPPTNSGRKATPEYQQGERGNRLSPSRLHGRYWHLVMLRDRLREAIASDHVTSGDRVLDYGCGTMPYRSFFEGKFSEYLGADLEGNPAADVTIEPDGRLPLEDRSVDCILSSQVLEHVSDPASYLAEAFRVLRPGGSLLLSTHGIWPYHPDPTDYWRWTQDGLVLQIERAGFRVERMAGVFGLLASAMQLLQDGVARSLPRWSRSLPGIVLQPLIGLMERGRAHKVRANASVYVVLAKKPVAPI